MEMEHSTLKAVWDRWDDPGDYPSNAGGGPLPSYHFIADVEGVIVVTLNDKEAQEVSEYCDVDVPLTKAVQEWLNEGHQKLVEHDINDICVRKWQVAKVEGTKITLEVGEFEQVSTMAGCGGNGI